MKKETIIAVLLTIIGVFLLLVIIGLTSKEETQVMTPVEVSSTFKDSFVSGCAEGSDTTYTQCACMYDTIVKNIGTDGMADMSANYLKTGKIPNNILIMVTPCVQ